MNVKGHAIPHLTNPMKHQCFLMYLAGFGPAEIEEKTKIPANRIRQWMFRDKWAEQRKEYEDFLSEKNPIASQPIVEAVKASGKGDIRKTFVEKAGKMAKEDIEHWADKMLPEERLEKAQSIAALNGTHRKNLELDVEAENKERGHITLTFLNNPDVKIIDSEKVKEIHAE